MRERRESGTTHWGALSLVFSTICVCGTAIVIAHMILSQQPPPSTRSVPLPAVPTPQAGAPPPALPASPALAPAAPAAPAPAGNSLLRNGDFEQLGGEGASVFEYWGYWGRWEKGNYTLESVPGHSGKYAAQISCVTPGRGGISQKLDDCKPGDRIQITFWVKADKAAGGRVFLNLEGTPGDGWASMDLKPGTYDWQEFTKVATCPPSDDPDYRIVLFFYNKSQGDVAIDDIVAVKLSE